MEELVQIRLRYMRLEISLGNENTMCLPSSCPAKSFAWSLPSASVSTWASRRFVRRSFFFFFRFFLDVDSTLVSPATSWPSESFCLLTPRSGVDRSKPSDFVSSRLRFFRLFFLFFFAFFGLGIELSTFVSAVEIDTNSDVGGMLKATLMARKHT